MLDLRFYFCPSFSGVRCRLVPGSSGQKARDQIDFQMSFKGKLVSSQKMSAACNLCAIRIRTAVDAVLYRCHNVLAVEVLAGTLHSNRFAHRSVWVWDRNRASGCRGFGDLSCTGTLCCDEDASRELWVEGRGHRRGNGCGCTPEFGRGHAGQAERQLDFPFQS